MLPARVTIWALMETAKSEKTAVPHEPLCAVVAIVGRTNSGKSTLLNHIMGEKISIVSPVVQTTRNVIRGVFTEPQGQLVFMDTPGLHKSENVFGTMMNRLARQAAEGVDIILMVADGSHPPQMEDEGWLRRLLNVGQPCVVFLNQNDKQPFYGADYKALWERLQSETGKSRQVPWIDGSAISGVGTDILVAELFKLAKPHPDFLFPPEIATDFPRKLAIADVIREKLLEKLHQELPHEVAVLVENIVEQPDGWQVNVAVLVNRHGQKQIVIGHKGRTLRFVKRKAEPELSEIFEVPVKLDLWVKIEKNWMKNFWILRQLGIVG